MALTPLFRRLHWMASAVALCGLLAFAFSGITLNHAAQVETERTVAHRQATLPPPLLARLGSGPGQGSAPLPAEVAAWVAGEFPAGLARTAAEWSAEEVYLSAPRPGGEAWLSIDRGTGVATYEAASRGAAGVINDLHTGRNIGPAWRWFIDAFAVVCLTAAVTGLALLWLNAGARRATWPLVAGGLVIPLILLAVLLHGA